MDRHSSATMMGGRKTISVELEVFHPKVFVKYKAGEVPSNTTVVKLNI